MTREEQARALVMGLDIHSGYIRVVDAEKLLAAALQAVERGVWEEAAKDLSHGLPAMWKDALKQRCAFKAAKVTP